MAVRRWRQYETQNHRSGGMLQTPRTPVESVMLRAKLIRLKREFEKRRAAQR